MRKPAKGLRYAITAFALCVLGMAQPASAQTTTFPQWMQDSFSLSNRYLRLWTYFQGGDESRFDLWTELGDPLKDGDDFTFFFTVDGQGNRTLVSPWGSRLFSGHPDWPADTRPYCNNVTIRVEALDQGGTTPTFEDLSIPEDGDAVFGPPTPPLPNNQGFFAPFRVDIDDDNDPNAQLEVVVKVQFARDLVRYELLIKNLSGTARRVAPRTVVDSYVDFWGPCRSVFLPESRERVFFEKDYGKDLGTTFRPQNPSVPDQLLMFDDDEGPNPVFVSKQILRGNGATTPGRLAIVNTLNPGTFTVGGYDYDVDSPQELRISDIGTLVYWDFVSIPARSQRSFVTYLGVGAADHVMSNAYIATQNIDPAYKTQGYIGALQTPFALGLVAGNADTVDFPATAFMQNQYNDSSLPNAFCFLDLPEGLEFSPQEPDPSLRRDLGTLAAVAQGQDEASGTWRLIANGADAGLLPVTVTYSNGFSDSSRLERMVNVPQGRRYQFSDEWRMVTFPFTYRNLADDPSVVFGLPPGSFQVVRFNPDIGAYEQVTQIQAGEGYWVRLLTVPPPPNNTQFVRLNDAIPVDLGPADTFTSPLRRGWNQAGNPNPYTLTVKDLRFLNTGGAIITFDQAVAAGFIRSAVFEYNRRTNQYVQLTRDSQVRPGQGIWIFSIGERNIVWPGPEGPELSITP